MPPRQPQKLLAVGDTHGNLIWLLKVVNYARAQGCDVILSVGDFGFWTDNEKTQQFLSELEKELEHCGIVLYWVDGNHENHARIYPMNKPDLACMGPWGPPEYPHIQHLPRGYRWKWFGMTWMALGGAHSVDRPWRVPFEDWWPEEFLSSEQVKFASRPGRVDVIVAHDCPYGVDIPGIGKGEPTPGGFWPYGELIRAGEHRTLVKQVVDATGPSVIIHGHYHVRYESVYDYDVCGLKAKVVGLDKDESTIEGNTVVISGGPPEVYADEG